MTCCKNQANDSQKELRRSSIVITAISSFILLISTTIAILSYGVDGFHDGGYIFTGFYAALWGIISGPIGISLSNRNNFSQSKRFCLWRAYIPLVTVTILGSIVGFSMNLFLSIIRDSDTKTKLLNVEAAGLIALLIVCSRTAWIFGCTRCQFNPSLEQEIIGNATRAADNEYVYSENVFGKKNNTKSKNTENNVYNLYNESFKSNESNLYDQYGEYNQYEPYRQRYAAYPW